MEICDVFIFNDGRPGYLAIVSPIANFPKNTGLIGLDCYLRSKSLQAFKYYGTDFGVNFPVIHTNYMKCMSIKTIRTADKFSNYIKLYNPNIQFNPIIIKNITFDIPYITFPNKNYIRWVPFFETKLNKKSFKLTDNIISYNYKKAIYILTMNSVRQVAKTNEEHLMINLNNGLITKSIKGVENNVYFDASYHVDQTGQWVCDSCTQQEIAGFRFKV